MHFKSLRLAVAALFIAPAAFATKPAVPTVTVGAETKQLRFDVEPVPGASSYELWFLPNGAATWVKYKDTIAADPLFEVTVSGHLLDWFNARYKVYACNSDGCSSTANISVTQHMKETVGYVKPRAASVDPFAFGQSPALSADGKTLAVLVGETIGPRQHSATVYVYQKADTGWQIQARLRPSLIEANTGERRALEYTVSRQLAISADGTAIILGVPGEFILTPNYPDNEGAAYLFRKTGTTWALEQRFGPSEKYNDYLGAKVDVDASGQTVALWRYYGALADSQGYWYVDVYRKGASGWSLFKEIGPKDRVYGVRNFDLSGDGKVLAVLSTDAGLVVYSGTGFSSKQSLGKIGLGPNRLNGLATNGDGSVIAVSTISGTPPAGSNYYSHITAYRRGASGWELEPAFTYLAKAPNLKTGYSDEFANHLAVSDDGKFIVAGDPKNRYVGTGALHTPIATGTEETGAVFTFERKATSWQLRSLIKPNVAYAGTRFGGGLALGDNNRSLAVSAIGEDSGARDIDGDQTSTSAPDSGALWLY